MCREFVEEILDMCKKSDINSFGVNFGFGVVCILGNFWNVFVCNLNGVNKDKGVREGFMKKMK